MGPRVLDTQLVVLDMEPVMLVMEPVVLATEPQKPVTMGPLAPAMERAAVIMEGPTRGEHTVRPGPQRAFAAIITSLWR